MIYVSYFLGMAIGQAIMIGSLVPGEVVLFVAGGLTLVWFFGIIHENFPK